jgi:Ser/Thr protein kinase RdoA (MazF antagonist)
VSIPLDSIPRISAAEAQALAASSYGLGGRLQPLPSERDQNFLVIDPARGKFVLKIANRDDSAALLDFQHEALRRVARAHCRVQVPQLVPSLLGEELARIERAGAVHHVRLLTWIEGTVLAEARPRGAALLESIGASMAEVDRSLEDFEHPAMHRVLQWDLRHAGLARGKAPLLPDPWRARVEQAFDRWETIDWQVLRTAVIHSDANDYNVLVGRGRMTGLLDFGDMVHSATVCELAIALAYAMLHEDDPLASAAAVIRGYHAVNPLTEDEQSVLYALIQARLAASLCYSAHNRARNPGDPYQVVSEEAVRRLVERLLPHSNEDACARIRAACAA